MVLGKTSLLIWIIVGHGPVALAVDAGCLDIVSLVYHFSLAPCLWETTRYRLKYCLKGPLNTKQPTKNLNFIFFLHMSLGVFIV